MILYCAYTYMLYYTYVYCNVPIAINTLPRLPVSWLIPVALGGIQADVVKKQIFLPDPAILHGQGGLGIKNRFPHEVEDLMVFLKKT